MPRYFLNLRYRGRLFPDLEGDELPGNGGLRAHALGAARDLIRNGRMEIIRDWLDCTFEITDEAGQTVLVLPFEDAVRTE